MVVVDLKLVTIEQTQNLLITQEEGASYFLAYLLAGKLRPNSAHAKLPPSRTS